MMAQLHRCSSALNAAATCIHHRLRYRNPLPAKNPPCTASLAPPHCTSVPHIRGHRHPGLAARMRRTQQIAASSTAAANLARMVHAHLNRHDGCTPCTRTSLDERVRTYCRQACTAGACVTDAAPTPAAHASSTDCCAPCPCGSATPARSQLHDVGTASLTNMPARTSCTQLCVPGGVYRSTRRKAMVSISGCRQSRQHHPHRRLQASSRRRGTANGGLPPRTSPLLHRHATPPLTIAHHRPARPLHTRRSTRTHCQRAKLRRAARHHQLHLPNHPPSPTLRPPPMRTIHFRLHSRPWLHRPIRPARALRQNRLLDVGGYSVGRKITRRFSAHAREKKTD